MIKKLHFKLAKNGLSTNLRLYVPYIIVSSFLVFTYFMLKNLIDSEVLINLYGGSEVQSTMFLGTLIMTLFSFLFINYTSNFVFKNRLKEYGVLSILGLSKGDISKVNILENIVISIVTIALGLILGLVLGKLFLMFFGKAMNLEDALVFKPTLSAIISTVIVFSGIYILNQVSLLWKMSKFNPLDFLQESKGGEREPKSRILLAVIGPICIGVGYIMALRIDNPVEALLYFFVAVIFVIAGTFILFNYFSTILLKGARRNKKTYYTKNRFIFISSMIYRMKNNALSLASIAILCTMVLVTISSTVSMFAGKANILEIMAPAEINFQVLVDDAFIEEKKTQYSVEFTDTMETKFLVVKDISNISFDHDEQEGILETGFITVMINDTYYSKIKGEEYNLKEDEVIVLTNRKDFNEDYISVGGKTYDVKNVTGVPKEFTVATSGFAEIETGYVLVFNNLDGRNFARAEDPSVRQAVSYNMLGSEDNIRRFSQDLTENNGNGYVVSFREGVTQQVNQLYGGLLVLGMFLGLVFIICAIMVIYYKQISEGFADRKSYEIMQKVGMSKQEIKQTINKQTNTIFFLPVVVAIVHLLFASNMIFKILQAMNFNNYELFVKCNIAVVLVFCVVYVITYKLTSRSYYSIVTDMKS